jgi:hypothetical protein
MKVKYLRCITRLGIPVAFLLFAFIPGAAHALTWSWSLGGGGGLFSASGTLTSDGSPPPDSGSIYNADSISGTYTDDEGTYNITGLSSFLGANNTFKWNPAGDIFIVSIDGFAFVVEGKGDFRFIPGDIDFGPPSDALASWVGGYSVDSNSLTPFTPAPVPAPLPILCAGMAYNWSRHLRRRLKNRS